MAKKNKVRVYVYPETKREIEMVKVEEGYHCFADAAKELEKASRESEKRLKRKYDVRF